MTYAALTGERKQSVQDAERLFSLDMVSFMKNKGYTYEEKFLRVVCNCRRAHDERGLTELQRCRFLTFITEELIPWYSAYPDFSLLEVNR